MRKWWVWLIGAVVGLIMLIVVVAYFIDEPLRRLRRDAPAMIVVGGWSSLTGILAPFASGPRTVKVMESESNLDSMRYKGEVSRRMRGAIVRQFDGFIVPGPRARSLLEAGRFPDPSEAFGYPWPVV